MTVPEQVTVTIDKCRVRVMRGGAGPKMLFLHGSGGASAWTPFMDELSQRFDLIVPEHPGFGASEIPAWLDNIADLAYFYLDFMDRFDLDKVHLVGNSLGGWIAAELAVRDASRIETLALISSAGLELSDQSPGNIFEWDLEELARNVVFDPAVAAFYLEQVVRQDLESRQKNEASVARLAKHPLLCNPDLGKWLHRIQAPTLILWGDSDRVFPSVYGREFARRIKHSKLVILSNCGHLPHIEKRAQVVEELIRLTERK